MDGVTIRRSGQHLKMPWKNGLGVTEEIAIEPEGASMADPFLWRLSSAVVRADGPFSLFPGYDRTLIVVDGDGMALDVDGRATTLDALGDPFVFPGDVPVTGTLRGGPIRDFNVMALRARVSARTRVVRAFPENISVLPETTTAVICLRGGCSVAGLASLAALDALFVRNPAEVVSAFLEGDGVAVVVEIAVR